MCKFGSLDKIKRESISAWRELCMNLQADLCSGVEGQVHGCAVQ